MEQSPQDQIESIVRSLEEKGIRAAPVAEAIALATSHPEAVSDLAISVMRRFPKGGTFLDTALSYLPQEDWPKLVQHALDTLEAASAANEAAAAVVAYAGLQCPIALHPHLSRIFLVRPNAQCYFESYPWRESGEQHFDYLRNVIESRSSSEDTRKRAWTAMFQTRQPRVIEFALSRAEFLSHPGSGVSPAEWAQAYLHLVGFRRDNDSLRRICPDTLYHLCFPASFFEGQSRPAWRARIHPSWKLPDSAKQTVAFGGNCQGHCSLCGKNLHRLLVLDPVPAGLGITRLPRLEFATCLSCLGWERQPLFYRHDEDGSPLNIGYDGPAVKPRFPVGPLKEAEIRLAETPRRWYWQDWALSNGRENLNRIGGEPCWIQNPEYPHCPSCKGLMSYLLQLDSDLATQEGGKWLWGSGGIGYGFWCDHCKVSGFLWQCT
jgi:hypothetical protein